MYTRGFHFREERAFIFCCMGPEAVFKGLEEMRTKNEKKGRNFKLLLKHFNFLLKTENIYKNIIVK